MRSNLDCSAPSRVGGLRGRIDRRKRLADIWPVGRRHCRVLTDIMLWFVTYCPIGFWSAPKPNFYGAPSPSRIFIKNFLTSAFGHLPLDRACLVFFDLLPSIATNKTMRTLLIAQTRALILLLPSSFFLLPSSFFLWLVILDCKNWVLICAPTGNQHFGAFSRC